MIQFNTLELNSDNSKLVLDISITDVSTFIDTIKIDTDSTFVSTGPSDKPVYTNTISGYVQSVHLELSSSDLNSDLNYSMFFIYVNTKTSSGGTTVESDYTLNVFYYEGSMYQYILKDINELHSPYIPKKLIDSILRQKIVEYSIKAGNYTDAILFYNEFYKPLIDDSC